MAGGYLDPGINAFLDFLFRDMLSQQSQERQFGYTQQLHEADQRARLEQARQELIQKAIQRQAEEQQLGQSLQSAFDLGYPEVTRQVPGTGVPAADILRERGRPVVYPEDLPMFQNMPAGGETMLGPGEVPGWSPGGPRLFEAINAAHPPGILTGEAEEREMLPIRPAETTTQREPSGLSVGEILARLGPQEKARILGQGATGGLGEVLGTLDVTKTQKARLGVDREAEALAKDVFERQVREGIGVAGAVEKDVLQRQKLRLEATDAEAQLKSLFTQEAEKRFPGDTEAQITFLRASLVALTKDKEELRVRALRALAELKQKQPVSDPILKHFTKDDVRRLAFGPPAGLLELLFGSGGLRGGGGPSPTPTPAPGASSTKPPQQPQGAIAVQLPNGQTVYFRTQQEADAFKRAAGIP